VRPQGLLTPAEAADRLHVSVSTFRRWRRSGLIPDIQLSQRTVRVDPAVIEEFIAAGYPRGARARAGGDA
jgi:excisionase family DNA binding protein